jgi:hypothetical protein
MRTTTISSMYAHDILIKVEDPYRCRIDDKGYVQEKPKCSKS